MKIWAQYIWIGGVEPTKRVKTLRSKGKPLEVKKPISQVEEIPEWTFDGSSTFQSEGSRSDLRLIPVKFIPDPLINICGENDILVLCEVSNIDGLLHQTNTRHRLLEAAKKYKKHQALFGFEQEYTLYDQDGDRPLRWPRSGSTYPAPQGRYYCGVGCDEVYGEEVMEEHAKVCLKAGLHLCGINPEVMPSQGEFQMGPLPAPEIADQLWLARYLLYKVAAKYNVSVKLDPKPIAGDWNGDGCHVHFSTKAIRRNSGLKAIDLACKRLEKFHKEHIAVYGPFNEQRLTGKHETAPISQFRFASLDRGASIRIPAITKDVKTHIEDRRPAANIDPYEVCQALLETVCGKGFKPHREPDVKL